MARRPLFRHDQAGELQQVSYNNHDRAPFICRSSTAAVLSRAGNICRAARRAFAALPAPTVPGSMVMFDNWRLLHAREAYVGYRRLAGAYLNREDVEARLRVLRIRAGRYRVRRFSSDQPVIVSVVMVPKFIRST